MLCYIAEILHNIHNIKFKKKKAVEQATSFSGLRLFDIGKARSPGNEVDIQEQITQYLHKYWFKFDKEPKQNVDFFTGYHFALMLTIQMERLFEIKYKHIKRKTIKNVIP